MDGICPAGIPTNFNVSSKEVYKAIEEPLAMILQGAKDVLEVTPPELASDIGERGIVLTGGGALLKGYG